MTVHVPPPRPVEWPLRTPDTAEIRVEILDDGRRRITIRHAELKGVTPAMLAWWYSHVEGDMEYAGKRMPRYLVWHPLDHISYEVQSGKVSGATRPGAKLHIREAFQRESKNLLDVVVRVERLDAQCAIIARRVLGLSVLRLVNRFEHAASGVLYTSEMTIGSGSAVGRMALNRILRAHVLAGEKAEAWVRHHIEEIGNLENFLPDLYASQGPTPGAP